jgi:hypothetical protein
MKSYTIIILCFAFAASLFAASSQQNIGLKTIPFSIETAWGPDAFGYIALDSNEPGGPPVDWIDISTIGTVVTGLGDDNIVGPFNIGFPFRYYWYDVNSFHVGSNGYLRFSGAGQLSSPFTLIPDPTPPNDVVCPYAADFDPSAGGTVYYWTNNVDTLIVSWDHLPAWLQTGSSGDHNFQVILSMVDTSLTFNIGPQSGTFFNASGMVGIENNAGDIGIYCYPNNILPSNYSIKFYYPDTTTFEVHDIGVTRVQNNNSGGFFVQTNDDLQANATIKNQGNQNEGDFYVIAEIRTFPTNILVYNDSVFVDTLEAGQELAVNFLDVWNMDTPGNYVLRIISNLPGDLVPVNDQIDVELHVVDLPGELSLDDGIGEQIWSWAGGNGGMGIYYLPPVYPVKVTQIRASLGAGTLPVLLQLYDDDGPNGEPGTLLTSVTVNATTANWYTINLSDSNIIINDEGVYAAWMMTGDGASGINLDQTSIGSRQTWEYTGVWATFRNNETQDAMIRISVEPYVVVVEEFVDHVTSLFRGSVTNEGTIGFLNEFPPAGPGSGFQFNPVTAAGQRLFEGAVMIGTDSAHVSDAARDENQVFDADFQFLTGFDSSLSIGVRTVYQTSYNDALAENPIGIEVVQTTYSVEGAGQNSGIIFQFDLTNTSGADLPEVYLGGFFDWDVDPATANDLGQVVVDSQNVIAGINNGNPFFIEVLELHQGSNPNSWMAVVPLSSNIFAGRRIAISNDEVYPPHMTDADKWTYMTENRATNPNGGAATAQDHGQVFGLPPVSIASGATERVGFAMGGGTSLSDVVERAREVQRVWVEDFGNNLAVLVTGIDDPLMTVPSEFALHQNYPNPFNPTTTIKYDLKQGVDVSLKIYNLLGQEVGTLVNSRQEAGYRTAFWDGLNNAGNRVASGIYIYRIKAGDFVQSRKMILMK